MDDKSICGIDFSISSPSICIIKEGSISIHCFHKNTSCYYLSVGELPLSIFTEEQKNKKIRKNMTSMEYINWTTDILIKYVEGTQYVAIEDYSFGSKGRVFQIAEATGILKHKLYNLGISVVPFAPKTIKKFATGNGNANKEMMVNKFMEETDINLYNLLKLNKVNEIPSPISDIADSYFVAKYYQNELEKEFGIELNKGYSKDETNII